MDSWIIQQIRDMASGFIGVRKTISIDEIVAAEPQYSKGNITNIEIEYYPIPTAPEPQESDVYHYIDGKLIPEWKVEKELICECGADSVGSPKHSNYCPKYKP